MAENNSHCVEGDTDESDSSSDMEMDLDEEEVAEMHIEAEVLQFNAILAEAQAIA
ncbi:hypothetical protein C0995_014210, partial [Termitomyces sp. Mi166